MTFCTFVVGGPSILVDPMIHHADLPSLRREHIDEQIVRILLDAVLAGRFAVGTALPPERELAGELGVNRTSLRLGLARLEQMGLIVSRQGHGNVVQDPTQLTDPEVVGGLLRLLGPVVVTQVLEVRSALGRLIGELAASRSRPADLSALDEAQQRVAGAAGAVERQQAEMAYFVHLVAATGNQVLGALVRWVDATYGQLPDIFAPAFEEGAWVVAGLERITRAVNAGHPAAAGRAVEAHFEATASAIAAAVEPPAPRA